MQNTIQNPHYFTPMIFCLVQNCSLQVVSLKWVAVVLSHLVKVRIYKIYLPYVFLTPEKIEHFAAFKLLNFSSSWFHLRIYTTLTFFPFPLRPTLWLINLLTFCTLCNYSGNFKLQIFNNILVSLVARSKVESLLLRESLAHSESGRWILLHCVKVQKWWVKVIRKAF